MVSRAIGPRMTTSACKLIAYPQFRLFPDELEADELLAVSENIRLEFRVRSLHDVRPGEDGSSPYKIKLCNRQLPRKK